jgi:hypothetical protein
VWHVSVGALPTEADRLLMAVSVLRGCGDRDLGEWHQAGGRIYHLQRRVSAAEAAIVGPVADIRGTPDAADRLREVRKHGRPIASADLEPEGGRPLHPHAG